MHPAQRDDVGPEVHPKGTERFPSPLLLLLIFPEAGVGSEWVLDVLVTPALSGNPMGARGTSARKLLAQSTESNSDIPQHERLNFPTGSASSLPCHNFVIPAGIHKAAALSAARAIWANLHLRCLKQHLPELPWIWCRQGKALLIPPVHGSRSASPCPMAHQEQGTERWYTKVWVLIIAFGNHGRSHSLWSDSAPCHLPSHRVSFFPEPLTVLL